LLPTHQPATEYPTASRSRYQGPGAASSQQYYSQQQPAAASNTTCTGQSNQVCHQFYYLAGLSLAVKLSSDDITHNSTWFQPPSISQPVPTRRPFSSLQSTPTTPSVLQPSFFATPPRQELLDRATPAHVSLASYFPGCHRFLHLFPPLSIPPANPTAPSTHFALA
jgi:hypothetical protein